MKSQSNEGGKVGKKRDRKLTKKEIRAMASARASAKQVTQIIDGDFVSWWGARLAGFFLARDGVIAKHPDRESAIRHAQEVKRRWARDA